MASTPNFCFLWVSWKWKKTKRNKKEGTWYWFIHMHYIPLCLIGILNLGLPWFRILSSLFEFEIYFSFVRRNIDIQCNCFSILYYFKLFCCCCVIVLQMQRHSQQELCGNTATVSSIFQKVRQHLEKENIILKCTWVIENVCELLGKGDLQKFWVALKQSENS